MESVEMAREDLAAAEEAAAVVARAEMDIWARVVPMEAVEALPAVAELVAVESVEMELVGMPSAAASILAAMPQLQIAK